MALKKHLFFCVNQRAEGRECCANQHAEALWAHAKQQLISLGMHNPENIRVNKAGCLGRCTQGAAVVVYPEGTWYQVKTIADVDEIIQGHIIDNTVVHRLLSQGE
jgi:(2Fe-2S) ferredoxin